MYCLENVEKKDTQRKIIYDNLTLPDVKSTWRAAGVQWNVHKSREGIRPMFLFMLWVLYGIYLYIRPSLVLGLHEILLRSCFALMAPWQPSWLYCHHSTKQTFPLTPDWRERCDLGLVQHGATGPSVLIDSDTEALILFPDQRCWGRPPSLASFYDIQPSFPFLCWVLGSLPSLMQEGGD